MKTNQILKLFKRKKQLLASVLMLCCVVSHTPAVVYAGDTYAESQISAVSLDYVSNLNIHIPGSILRLYGSPGHVYAVPIQVMTDCTIILDNVVNQANLTVSDGCRVTVLLRGSSSLYDILAVGGANTNVCIKGETPDAALSAGQVACSSAGTTQTGANIQIESCTFVCQELGCGRDGIDYTIDGSSVTVANASPGSNASPNVSISRSRLTVHGSIACGGNGIRSLGSWTADASDGGTAGEVVIDQSDVSVGGSIAVGGKGGEGGIAGNYYDSISGTTQSAQPVCIRNHSTVVVGGNVAKQQDLPEISKDGTQKGLDGVTVEITDSTLSAKDIASGGNGHNLVRYNITTGTGSRYDVIGTRGGNGGTIIARNSFITCETAVCGANAGDYRNYEMSMYGTTSGDYENVYHPADGNGGRIDSENSEWTVTACAGEKGSRWAGYANPSVYSDQRFIGGALNGIVKGAVITTDLTAILGGDFVPSAEIRNSEEASCSKCLLKTGGELANQAVSASANELRTSTRLDGSGQLSTYLSIGTQRVRMNDSQPYGATVRVRRAVENNTFQLHAYGRLDVTAAGAEIYGNSYRYQGERYEYNGDYTISGIGNNTLTIDGGSHRLIFGRTDLDTLEIKGNAVVTVRIEDVVKLRRILVAEGAVLIIEGDRRPDYETCEGSLSKADGTRLFPFTFTPDAPDNYDLYLNGEKHVLTPADQMLRVLLPEGDCEIRLEQAPFVFRGTRQIHEPLAVSQSELLLELNCSLAPVTIAEETVSFGENQIRTRANVCLSQEETLNCVSVTRTDAILWLDQIAPNIQIYVPEDFAGEIRDLAGAPIRLVTIHTGKAEYPMAFELDGIVYEVVTNADGYFTLLATVGTHQFRLIIDDVSYELSESLDVSEDAGKNRYSEEDLIEQKPDTDDTTPSGGDTDGDTDRDTDTDGGTGGDTDGGTGTGTDADGGTGAGSNTDTDTGTGTGTDIDTDTTDPSQPPAGETGTDKNTDSESNSADGGSTGDNSAGSSSGAGGSTGDGSGGGASFGGSSSGDASSSGGFTGGASSGGASSGGASTGNTSTGNTSTGGSSTGGSTSATGTSHLTGARTGERSDEQAEAVPVQIQISQQGIILLEETKADDTVFYTKKDVRFDVTVPDGAVCSYQIIHLGEAVSQTEWIPMDMPSLTLTEDRQDTRARRVIFQLAYGDRIIRQLTNYFVIDRKRPVISGIRHLRFYHKSRRIHVSDNALLREVRLNGKKVKADFTLRKRGIYFLKATDQAGNRRQRVFAIW